jgi:hypothetical protein
MYYLYPELVNVLNNAKTLNLLIKCIMDTWDKLGEDLFNKLINTMERKVKAVIDAEGWYKKY